MLKQVKLLVIIWTDLSSRLWGQSSVFDLFCVRSTDLCNLGCCVGLWFCKCWCLGRPHLCCFCLRPLRFLFFLFCLFFLRFLFLLFFNFAFSALLLMFFSLLVWTELSGSVLASLLICRSTRDGSSENMGGVFLLCFRSLSGCSSQQWSAWAIEISSIFTLSQSRLVRTEWEMQDGANTAVTFSKLCRRASPILWM